MRPDLKKLFFIAMIFFNISCTPYRDIPYFQDLDHTKISQEDIKNYSPLKIQVGDILGFNVNSLSPEAADVFSPSLNRVTGGADNPTGSRSNSAVGAENVTANPIFGFRVDLAGEIELRYLGKIKVVGLTTDELGTKLSTDLAEYLKKPIVNVRILNFKISVVGDVLRPDVFTIQNERITIMEALGLAGDLNITAKRKNVLLIRENDGKRQYLPIDLTSKKIFTSPYYYLQNNDVIYVEPDRTKYAPLDRGYRTLTLLFSAISALSIILTGIVLYNQNQNQ